MLHPNLLLILLFKGEDLREGNSPSWFNPVEAVQVMKYLQSLRSSDKFSLKLTDIGVITPYRKQVGTVNLLKRVRAKFPRILPKRSEDFILDPKSFKNDLKTFNDFGRSLVSLAIVI